ncbi:MAG: hypothetical protein BECKG1743E_GA0114224_110181, partial [Candidatus Kentron sp. G]
YPADVKCLGFLYLYVGRYPRNNASRNTKEPPRFPYRLSDYGSHGKTLMEHPMEEVYQRQALEYVIRDVVSRKGRVSGLVAACLTLEAGRTSDPNHPSEKHCTHRDLPL